MAIIGKHDDYWDIYDQLPKGWVAKPELKAPIKGHVFIHKIQKAKTSPVTGRPLKIEYALLELPDPEQGNQQSIFQAPAPKVYPQRTITQNKALHLLFTMLADELNTGGLDMKTVFKRKPEVAIPWDGEAVKKYLWRPIQQAQLDKKSTTQLTTVEIDKVFDTLNRFLGEAFGISMDFPSVEATMMNQRLAKKE